MIWDLPTRLFHWLLALAFTVAFVSAKLGPAWIDWHLRAGYLLLALILFRLLWGFCGSQTSRFAEFLKSPNQVLGYLGSLRTGRSASQPGHNPAGGWMIVLMLSVLLGVAVTGLFADDLIAFSGPLASCVVSESAETSARYHVLSANFALVLIGLHLLAIAFYGLVLRENLLPAMVGRPSIISTATVPPMRVVSRWLALAVFLTAVAAVWLLASGTLCASR